MTKAKLENKKINKILKSCINFGKTTGIDTPTAIERYIHARKGEIFQEKRKIMDAKLKINRIQKEVLLAESSLTRFWIKETNGRKKLLEKHTYK